MRAIGIREMKSRFSEYLRLVAEGEVVLVTDRGRVVAQLAPPPAAGAPPVSEEAALRRLAAAGKVRLPTPGSVLSAREGPVKGAPTGLDIAGILNEMREDRTSAILPDARLAGEETDAGEEADGE